MMFIVFLFIMFFFRQVYCTGMETNLSEGTNIVTYDYCDYTEGEIHFHFTVKQQYLSDIWIFFENDSFECSEHLENPNMISCLALTPLDVLDVLNRNFVWKKDYFLYTSSHANESDYIYHSNFTFDICNLQSCQDVVFISKIESVSWENSHVLKVERTKQPSPLPKDVNYYYALIDFNGEQTKTFSTFDMFLQINSPCNLYKYCIITEWEYCSNGKSYKTSYKDCKVVSKSANITTNDVSCDYQADLKSLVLSSQYIFEKIYFNDKGIVNGFYDHILLDNVTVMSIDEKNMVLSGCIDCSCFYNEPITCRKPFKIAVASNSNPNNTIAITVSLSFIMMIAVILAFFFVYRYKKQQAKICSNEGDEKIVDIENLGPFDGNPNEIIEPSNEYAYPHVFTNIKKPEHLSDEFCYDSNGVNKITKKSSYEEILPENNYDILDSDEERQFLEKHSINSHDNSVSPSYTIHSTDTGEFYLPITDFLPAEQETEYVIPPSSIFDEDYQIGFSSDNVLPHQESKYQSLSKDEVCNGGSDAYQPLVVNQPDLLNISCAANKGNDKPVFLRCQKPDADEENVLVKPDAKETCEFEKPYIGMEELRHLNSR